jgi:hypothetical protein
MSTHFGAKYVEIMTGTSVLIIVYYSAIQMLILARVAFDVHDFKRGKWPKNGGSNHIVAER